MKRGLAVSVLLALATVNWAQGQNQPDSAGVYWILLRDKGPDIESRIDDIQKELPERTIKRRLKGSTGKAAADEYDLPVYGSYIDLLKPYILKLREESRWLNAVSAVVDRRMIETIEGLEFVTGTRPVSRSNLNSIDYEVTESWTAGAKSEYHPGAAQDYGRSFDQLEQIDVIWAHEQGYHGEGVIICFLDTGFLTYHRAFNQMNIIAAYDFINDDDFVGYDESQDLPGQPNHGTGCLGTIGGYYPGELIGPAFRASFILCKTEDTGSETAAEEDYYVAGLEWGERMGADVASSSLSYSDWYTAEDYDGRTCLTTIAANIAFQKGMILCSSMGNSGPGKFTLGAPADSPYSLGIGAVRWNGELAGFSSWGPTADGRIKPDVCARGVATVAATPFTTDGFGLWNGTSLSCPLAGGATALVVQAHPDWSPSMVKEALLETSDKASHPDIRFGWGVLNVKDAINYPSFSGYLVDEDTHLGISAELSLDEMESRKVHVSISDSSGYFLLANLEYGRYHITIQPAGYLPFEKTIEIPPSEEFDIYLKKVSRD